MLNIVKVSSVLLLTGSIAWAQQPHHGSPAHGADPGADAVATDAIAFELPEACRQGEHPVGEMGGMGEMTGEGQVMLEHQQANMESMMRTHGPMMQGMMLEDPDLAFACAMIPHHQGAIDMAQVQLQYGADEEMQALARTIIDDQEREIEELLSWIERYAP